MASWTTDSDPLAPHSLSASELKELIATERLGIPFLAYRDELDALRVFQVQDSERPFTLGRRSEMDLAVDWDEEVSGIHAELQRYGGEVTIIDDGLSTNGTFVNGQKVVGRSRLRDRDRIRVGRTLLTYRSGEWPGGQTTVAAIETPGAIKLTDTQREILVALCRPLADGAIVATPATNSQIAAEVCLSVEAVKTHLRSLFGKFELADLSQGQKRAKLAERALQHGIVTQRDLV